MIKEFSLPKTTHFIDGRWIASANGETFTNFSPHNNKPLCEISAGGAEEINLAVEAANKALNGPWSKLTIKERSAVVKKLGDLIKENLEELACLEAIDTGKPYLETSTGDIPRAILNMHHYSVLIESTPDKHWKNPDNSRYQTIREPIGVVGLITPWNLPLYLLTWKLAPALVCGNTVVAKPAELTPLSANALCTLIQKAGIPDGVVNIVHGFGPNSAGQALVEHPDVKAISFTGETLTGQAIMAKAAPLVKKLSFELGGKGASLVFKDADLKLAAEGCTRAAYRNQGQVCLAGSRLIVHKSIANQLVDLIVGQTKEIKLGHPLNPSTTMGALISIEHRNKVQSYVEYARTIKGVEIVAGGKIPSQLSEGAYFEPTIINNVPQDSRLIQEEIFGPVMTVQTFEEFDEAMSYLNDTKYGLSCSIWSENKSTLDRATRNARTGMVWHNSWMLRNLNAAFGGMKLSGIGREGGEYSLDFYSELKTIGSPA